ncbi:MAG: SRPBCC family protein [Burkholderiaceae bacterium]
MQASPFDALVDDRPDEGIFRVHRKAFVDAQIFEQELQRIFGATWVFLGLEDQVSQPHDYLTWSIGRTPVVVSRSSDGQLRGFINACRHKGAMVVTRERGNARRHTCPYHAWVYDAAGRNVSIKAGQVPGCYGEQFEREDHDLLPLPALAVYRGLIFGSLNPSVEPLHSYLGDMRVLLDLILDQGEHGMEFVPGKSSYTFNGNWKLQMDNGIDYYHLTSAHVSYMSVLGRRKQGQGNQDARSASWERRIQQRSGMFGFDKGHVTLWMDQPEPGKRPIFEYRDELRARVGELRLEWMFRPRQYLIFPNLQFADSSTTLLRTFRPLSPSRTEMRLYCLAPKGEPESSRLLRMRQFEDFFAASGLATPDDSVLYERCQRGMEAGELEWLQGYARAIPVQQLGPTPESAELGITPSVSVCGEFDLQNEVAFLPPWRAWKRMMQAGGASGEGAAPAAA